jgi:putative SOS response-associated peptidase YedK
MAMCGRFALHANPEVIALQFRLAAAPAFAPRYNIAPTAEILAITESGAAPLRWGLFGKVYNLRADKPRGRLRPCLVPASGFYEWQRRGTRKQPYYVRPAHDALFGFAGLYGHGNCAILTVEANGVLSAIHDRMPAIVAPRDYARWLDGAALALAPAADASVSAYPVGAEINSGTAESPRLVEPLPSGVAPRGASGSLFGD